MLRSAAVGRGSRVACTEPALSSLLPPGHPLLPPPSPPRAVHRRPSSPFAGPRLRHFSSAFSPSHVKSRLPRQSLALSTASPSSLCIASSFSPLSHPTSPLLLLHPRCFSSLSSTPSLTLSSTPPSVHWLSSSVQWLRSCWSAVVSQEGSVFLRFDGQKSLQDFLSKEAKKGEEAAHGKRGVEGGAAERGSGGGVAGSGQGLKGKDSEGKASPSAGGGGGDNSGGGGGGSGSSKKKPTIGGAGSGGGSGGGGFEVRADRTLIALGVVLVTLLVLDRMGGPPSREITFQDFRNNFLETGRVQRLLVHPEKKFVAVLLKPEGASGHGGATNDGFSTDPDISDRSTSSSSTSSSSSSSSSSTETRPSLAFHFAIGSVEAFERALDEAQKEMGLDPRDHVQVQYQADKAHLSTAFTIFQIAVFGVLAYQLFRGISAMGSGGFGAGGGGGRGGRNIFSIGKSPATLIKPGEMTKVTFTDVAGLDEAKVEVLEFVKFLKAPEQFTRLGAKIPKGALLVGPPGTGKTLLAKAMAGEASVPFFSISGSDFLEMFVGVGPSRVRDLFAQARTQAPCIVFIDEIDAVGRSRGSGRFSGGNDERENTLNQLLVEMDGFSTTEGVVVLAATNRKDILDKALLRPGRFDRTITIDKPDLRGRTQIFLVHLRGLKVTHDRQDLAQRLSALTPGFAGADVANLCNEAALIAARANKDHIELVDFEKASDRILGGLEKNHSIMTAHEKKRVAYHEAGHAVIGWFLEHADPLLKVTIVPRGSGALGFAQYLPKELSLYTQPQLLDMMCMTLGGRAAEQFFFTDVSTGAADDLQKVTRIAQAQISSYGMSKRLGNVSYHQGNGQSGGEGESFTKPFSEATAQTIDEEVRLLINTAYDRTCALIQQHAALVLALAERLIATETVNHDALVQVLGPRPFVTDAYAQWMLSGAEEAQVRAEKERKEEEEERKKAAKKSSAEQSHSSKGDDTPLPQPILNPI